MYLCIRSLFVTQVMLLNSPQLEKSLVLNLSFRTQNIAYGANHRWFTVSVCV